MSTENNQSQNNYQLFHDIKRTEKGNVRRVATIVYHHDRNTNTLTYGASMYRHDNPDHKQKGEEYNRKNNNRTALERFLKRPVVVEEFKFEEQYDEQDGEQLFNARRSYELFHKKIRQLLINNGVKGERNSQTESEEQREVMEQLV